MIKAINGMGYDDCICYVADIIDWKVDKLKNQKLISIKKALHPKADGNKFYVSPEKGLEI